VGSRLRLEFTPVKTGAGVTDFGLSCETIIYVIRMDGNTLDSHIKSVRICL